MANVTVSRMWIFGTAVSAKMVTTTYRILIATAVNVSRAFHRVTYLLLTEFEVRTVSYGPRFVPFDLGPRREVRGP